MCDGSGRFLFTTPFLTSFDRCRTRFSGSSRSGSSRGSNGRSRSSGGRGRRRDRGNRGWHSLDCRCLPFGLSRFWLDFGRLRRAGGARYMAWGHSASNGRSCLSRRRRYGRRFGRSRSSMGFLAVSEGWRLCRLPVSKGRRGSSLWRGDRLRLRRLRRLGLMLRLLRLLLWWVRDWWNLGLLLLWLRLRLNLW